MSKPNIPPWLRPFDPVAAHAPIGEVTTTQDFSGEGPISPPSGLGDVRLKIVRGLTTRDYVMGDDEVRVVIGRGREEAEFALMDPTLAARQLVVLRLGHEVLVINCNPRQQMRVNGVLTEQASVPVPSHSYVEVGQTGILMVAEATGNPPPNEGRHVAARPGEIDSIPGPPDCRLKLVLDKQSCVCTDRHVFIGSDPSCDLNFRGRGLADFHAMVSPTENGVMLIPISTDETLLNGDPIQKPVMLDAKSVITICERSIAVMIDGDPHTRAAQLYGPDVMRVENFTFRSLFSEYAQSFTIPRNGGVISLGRADDCDVTIKETSISRDHADLSPNLNNVLLIDKDSSNGCFINERKVSQNRLRSGDFVEFGRNPFIVHYS